MCTTSSALCLLACHAPAPLPRTLWIELTSRCPFDCVFCSRRLRRGAGENLDFGVYESLLRELDSPECIRLNYSGESIHYPRLLDAIRLAKGTGARVELVTALAGAPESHVRGIAGSGLDSLCLSLHAARQSAWQSICRHESLDRFRQSLETLLETTAKAAGPELAIAFVAMRRNLTELPGVVALARRYGIRRLTVCPVIRRDPVEEMFEDELEHGYLRETFKEDLRRALDEARRACPEIDVQPGSPELYPPAPLRQDPGRFWPQLTDGAQIPTCDQSPWETVHVLANGDVVPCEVQDDVVLGNLQNQSLREIWQGETFRRFRQESFSGSNPVCTRCTWKSAWIPSSLPASIGPDESTLPPFFRGWHPRDSGGTLWSRGDAALVLRRADGSRGFRLHGALPPSPGRPDPNRLQVRANGELIGEVRNPGPALVEFQTILPPPAGAGDLLVVRFSTSTTWRPALWSAGSDTRDLGFALFRMVPLP